MLKLMRWTLLVAVFGFVVAWSGAWECNGEDGAGKGSRAIRLFDAVENNLVSVKFIPLNSEKANVLFENKTNEAIDLDLPSRFGALHIHAQFGQGIGNGQAGGNQFAGQNGGGQNAGAGGQQLGGGFGQGMGQGMAGRNGGFGQGAFGQGIGGQGIGGGADFRGGMFRIEANSKRRLSVDTVCLEFGKPDPNPRMSYRLVPLEEVSKDPGIAVICQQLANGEILQSVAQASAWHLTDELSWNELAEINRVESKYTGNFARFSSSDLFEAAQFVAMLQESASISTGNSTGKRLAVAPGVAARD